MRRCGDQGLIAGTREHAPAASLVHVPAAGDASDKRIPHTAPY